MGSFLRLRLVSSLSLFAVAACAGSSRDATSEAPPFAEDDLVSRDTFDRAFAIVQGVDYLPFDYKADGCYARALYMSMELAAQGLESNSVFAFAAPGTELEVGDVTWVYHVAPMLEVGANTNHATHFVIDPALSSAALTQAQWVAKMTGALTTSPPSMLVVPGSDYGTEAAATNTAHGNRDTPDFSSLPPFRASDIQDACEVVHGYLGLETGSTPTTVSTKRQKLLARTTALVVALRAKQKLTEDTQVSVAQCSQSARQMQ